MSVEDTRKIDAVAMDKNPTDVTLLISDHLDWVEDEGAHLLLLQNKLNAYLEFIESGELVQKVPRSAGLPVIILVDAKFPLSPAAQKFFDLAKGAVKEVGVSLDFELSSKS